MVWLISCNVTAKVTGKGHENADYDRAKEEGRARGRAMLAGAQNDTSAVIINDGDGYDVKGDL